jgi:hypothetical protein
MWRMTRRAGKRGVWNTRGLSDAELRVLAAFPTGSCVKLAAGNAGDDPARGESWGPDRQVRARFLLSLLCGAVEVGPDMVGEIDVDGACVIGKLGFPGVAFKHRLHLNNCYVPDGIELTEGSAQTLRLEGCRVAAIYLLGAKIDGSLTLSGSHVGGTGRRAISADRLALTGNMYCDEGFRAYGEVVLSGASIGGQLIFRGAHLTIFNSGGYWAWSSCCWCAMPEV